MNKFTLNPLITKTVLSAIFATVWSAQLLADEKGGATPAPLLPASSYPKVELPPKTVAAERGLETAPRVDTPSDRELEAASAKMWADRPKPDQERREEAEQKTKQKKQSTESFTEARKQMSRERHDRAWWDQRYQRIVRASTGYYYLKAGYWYPAFGYDP
jgi:hypothetical protein